MTEVMQKVAIDFKLDRSSWEPVKFGDVAIQQKQSVDRENTSITRYVKGEHMGSEDIHLREWGELKDEYLGPAFIRKFEEGDILYGSRRTYLKKVVVAPFEGITANTTFAIKANTDIIDQRLLPFLLLSEGFTEHSIKNSKGSVNPYINWKDIANYEFLLPPKDQQSKLTELLWAMDEVIEKAITVQRNINVIYKSIVKNRCIEIDGIAQPLSNIIDKLIAGVSVNSEEGAVLETDMGILKTSAVSEGFFDPSEVKQVLSSELNRLRTPVKKNTIIISRMNTTDLVGANGFVDKDYPNLFLPDRLWQTCISRPDVNVKYLWCLLSSPQYRTKISSLCTGTSNSMKNISKESFFSIKVVLPEMIYQEKCVEEIETIEKVMRESSKEISLTKSLQKSIINQVFS